MAIDDLLLRALTEQFHDRRLRTCTPPDPLVVFPAKHAMVGDVRIWRPDILRSTIGRILMVRLAVGDLLFDEFENFDDHLDVPQRAERVIRDVVRFLNALFDDRLLFWESADGKRGWRECRDAVLEPLVLDNRIYRTYLWSGPLAEWQAIPAILARGRIRDERDHQIVVMHLSDESADRLQGTDRERAIALLADYDRGTGRA